MRAANPAAALDMHICRCTCPATRLPWRQRARSHGQVRHLPGHPCRDSLFPFFCYRLTTPNSQQVLSHLHLTVDKSGSSLWLKQTSMLTVSCLYFHHQARRRAAQRRSNLRLRRRRTCSGRMCRSQMTRPSSAVTMQPRSSWRCSRPAALLTAQRWDMRWLVVPDTHHAICRMSDRCRAAVTHPPGGQSWWTGM